MHLNLTFIDLKSIELYFNDEYFLLAEKNLTLFMNVLEKEIATHSSILAW